MQIHRRQFLKYCLGSAAALGLPLSVVGKLENAFADETVQLPKVIWLNGANCTGCTVSLANRFSDQGPKDVVDLLTGYIDLAFHPNLMAAAGDLAVECLQKAEESGFILAVDGGIPTAFNGHTCTLWTENGEDITAKAAVQRLAPKAAAILSIGTCASFGGIPAANPNPTGIASVSEIAGKTTINIPGCPTHPDWIVWTVASLLAGEIPELDDRGRPRLLFNEEIHKKCPRKGTGEAKIFGEETCLKELGCKGPRTKADCHIRKWNDGTNWCIGANAICLGCTEDGFPDKFSPFYKIEYGYQTYDKNDNPNSETTTLRLTKAEWRTDNSELRVEGQGKIGAIVKVSAADAGVMLGAVSVGSDGNWRFRQKNPVPIPGRVKVESSGEMVFTSVKNAPAGGGSTINGTTKTFRIKKAEWSVEKLELKVEGEGKFGNMVDVSEASTGARLGMVSVDTEGKWKFRQKNPVSVPRRIRAESNGIWKERDVLNPPQSTSNLDHLFEKLVSAA
jgi:hydrogenase small subunit